MFNQLTIVGIDGRTGDSLGTQRAIHRSAEQLPGSKQLFVSAQRPTRLLDGLSHHLVQPLGYFEYELFVLYGLHQLIETPYALIVQDDGWVLDGKNWRDEFWSYDYIGAPIHAAAVTHNGERMYHKNFQWAAYLNQAGAKIDFVQNGGFSLRSKRFLEVFSQHQIPYHLAAPQTIVDSSQTSRFLWPLDHLYEDVYCCVHVRGELERAGMRFAPLEVARYFSFEHWAAGVHDGIEPHEVMGQHSRLRKLAACHPYEVQYQITESELDGLWGESLILGALKRQGAKVEFKQP